MVVLTKKGSYTVSRESSGRFGPPKGSHNLTISPTIVFLCSPLGPLPHGLGAQAPVVTKAPELSGLLQLPQCQRHFQQLWATHERWLGSRKRQGAVGSAPAQWFLWFLHGWCSNGILEIHAFDDEQGSKHDHSGRRLSFCLCHISSPSQTHSYISTICPH